MPASAWAAGSSGSFILDGVSYATFSSRTWAEVFPEGEIGENGEFILNGKYVVDEKTGINVLATDFPLPDIFESYSYITVSIPLDFTAPESLSMRATQGSSELSIDPCVINNTGTEDLKLSQVEITAATGWTVVDSSTDFTTADSKNKIAFKTGTHDFSSGAYSPGEKITAGGNATVQLEGKISEKADLTNATQVASMIVTVEKNVSLISFTIAGTSYHAEEGMMWEEWIASDYNTGNTYGKYSVNEYGSIGYLLPKGYWVAIHDSEKGDYVSPTDTIKSDFEYDAV